MFEEITIVITSDRGKQKNNTYEESRLREVAMSFKKTVSHNPCCISGP